MGHHALGEQRVERLGAFCGQMPRLLHRTREEARIKKVQNRVLNPADILIYIHPIFGLGGIGGRCRARRSEAGVIPRAVHECVHRVGFTLSRRTTGRAGAIAPSRVTIQRVAWNVETDIARQFDGQVFLFLRNNPTGGTMHHRDRTAPIALTRQAPIAQTEFGHALAPTLRLSEVNSSIDRHVTCLHGLACKAANIAHTLGLSWYEGFSQRGLFRALGHKNRFDGQIEFVRKFKITLVMGRAAENRARAIIHQNEIRDPNGQFPRRIKRVAHTQARVTALFLGLFQGFGSCSTLAAVLAECGNLGVFCFKCFG